MAASRWRHKIYGTPQGSVFGPILWNLFFNPLLTEIGKLRIEQIHTTPRQEEERTAEEACSGPVGAQSDNDTDGCPFHNTWATVLDDLDTAYADDLTLLASSHIPRIAEEHLEQKLEVFRRFLDERGMVAASHKLKVMSLDPHGRNYKPIVKYQGNPITCVDEHRFLGVILDKDMSFVKHWEMITKQVTSKTKTLRALSAAKWGPTQQTAKVVHHSYIESRITFGILAWYPFLHPNYKNKLELLLLRSIRVVMGLPQHCQNLALRAEANLDSVLELAQKCAMSYYVRLNPRDTSSAVLAKTLFNQKLPVWTTLITGIQNSRSRTGIRAPWKGDTDFPGIPTRIWKGPIQTKLDKKEILAVNTTQAVTRTLETQAKADIEENEHKYILYTDASVNILSNPPGSASIGYIWYKRSNKNCNKNLETNQDHPKAPDAPDALAALDKHQWQELARGNANIGSGHSSYSAESIAIRIGLKNEPRELSMDKVEKVATRIGIFTDSLSNVTTISRGVAKTLEQAQLFKSIANCSRPITFYHVRSHHNNQKNIEVDKLCDIGVEKPNRTNMENLEGKKTPAKIKEWTKRWFAEKRLAAPLLGTKTNAKTQSWIT